jgi:hypothetical protein
MEVRTGLSHHRQIEENEKLPQFLYVVVALYEFA